MSSLDPVVIRVDVCSVASSCSDDMSPLTPRLAPFFWWRTSPARRSEQQTSLACQTPVVGFGVGFRVGVGVWRRLERQDENLFTVHRMILCSMGLITFDADPRSAEKHLKARGLAGGSRGLASSSVAEEVPQES